jgi:hypothetical protein
LLSAQPTNLEPRAFAKEYVVKRSSLLVSACLAAAALLAPITSAHALTYAEGSGFTGKVKTRTVEFDAANKRILVYVDESDATQVMYTAACGVMNDSTFRFLVLPTSTVGYQDMLSLLLAGHLSQRKMHFRVTSTCSGGQPVIDWVALNAE